MSFMERLKQYLIESKTSQESFAELVGVKQPTVWEWLHGESMPGPRNLKRISSITGISIDDLLSHVDQGRVA